MSDVYKNIGSSDNEWARLTREDGTYVNIAGSYDVFGKSIADGTTNELDLASHYPYSPERWRIVVDGTRVFPEYETVSQYNHGVDVHEITPAADQTVIFETEEVLRYVVQYEQEATFAIQINQALQEGDSLKLGPFSDQNGWYIEQTGTHDALQADLVIRRAGSEKKRVPNLTLKKPFTSFARYSNRYSWYNVGPSKWTQFFTKDNKGVIHDIGSISVDDDTRGPQKGNMPLRVEVTTSASTTGLQVDVGSVALVTLGNTEPIVRLKGANFFDENVSATDTWVPIRAFRLAERTDIVNVQLRNFNVLDYSSDTTIELLAMAMPVEKVTFGSDGWSVPDVWNATNNALETRTDITGIPDNGGNIVANATNLGGYQIGRSVLIPVSGQFQKGISSGGVQQQKRDIPTRDYLVIFGKASQTGNATYEFVTEQDW